LVVQLAHEPAHLPIRIWALREVPRLSSDKLLKASQDWPLAGATTKTIRSLENGFVLSISMKLFHFFDLEPTSARAEQASASTGSGRKSLDAPKLP
jgi:hypothetical protein